MRDSGILRSLLRLEDLEQVLGHPIAGMSGEGYVIETLIRAAPPRAQVSFYRTAAGAKVDLVLELAGGRRWAIEVKRGLAPKVEKGFRMALQDLGPGQVFLVYRGGERYPKGQGIEAIGIRALAQMLAALG